MRATVESLGFGEVQVQNFGTSRDVLIRVPVRGDVKQGDVVASVFAALCKAEGGSVGTREATATGRAGQPAGLRGRRRRAAAAVAQRVRRPAGRRASWPTDGAKALAFVVIGIMVYLAFRFEWKFAVAAIVANLHDVIIILGFFAFFQWEFSLSVLAAVLAVLGYSVNESVVIFDRIREAFRSYRKMTTHEVIDHAITSTISRTIITHGSHADDGAVDAAVRRADAALFRDRADDRHPVRHLLVGVRRRRHRDVAGRQARRPGQDGTAKDRDPNDPNAGAVV